MIWGTRVVIPQTKRPCLTLPTFEKVLRQLIIFHQPQPSLVMYLSNNLLLRNPPFNIPPHSVHRPSRQPPPIPSPRNILVPLRRKQIRIPPPLKPPVQRLHDLWTPFIVCLVGHTVEKGENSGSDLGCEGGVCAPVAGRIRDFGGVVGEDEACY